MSDAITTEIIRHGLLAAAEEMAREVIQGGSYNHLAADDVLVNNAGGGYGNRFDREPERVAHDVGNGFVSVEPAARDYGVAIPSDTFEVGTEATGRLRRDVVAVVSA